MGLGVVCCNLLCVLASLDSIGPSFEGVKGLREEKGNCGTVSLVVERTNGVPLKNRGVLGVASVAFLTARWIALIFFFPSFCLLLATR